MDQLNRRAMMRGILRGAAVVGVGLVLPLGAVDAMPVDTSLVNAPEGLIADAQWSTQHWRHGNNWHGNNWNRRRGRRWVCWWHRGRRVCGWR
jgi:hypothetical protein